MGYARAVAALGVKVPTTRRKENANIMSQPEYLPGDVVNGHRLGEDNVWHPIAQAVAPPATNAVQTGGFMGWVARHKVLAGIAAALLLMTFIGAASNGDGDETTTSTTLAATKASTTPTLERTATPTPTLTPAPTKAPTPSKAPTPTKAATPTKPPRRPRPQSRRPGRKRTHCARQSHTWSIRRSARRA